MIYIGCHLSVTNGYEAMGRQMVDFGKFGMDINNI